MMRKTLLLLGSLFLLHATYANDDCSNAQQLTPGTTCANTTTTFSGSTLSGAAPSCGASASQDIWFMFTATDVTMSITLSATSGLNHGFELIQGSCGGTVIACVNSNSSSFSESYFNNNFTPGQTYYIRVFNAAAGLSTVNFNICVQNYPAPANDLCSNATLLTPNTSCLNTTVSLSGASNESGSPSCVVSSSQDIWFRFVATDVTMSINLGASSGLNHGFEIIEGSCTGTVVACVNSNGSSISESYFNNTFTPGQTYYIRVFNATSSLATSNFSICVQNYPVPVNDLCSNSTLLTPNISCLNTSATFSGAGISGASPSCVVNSQQDVWFHFVASDPTMSIVLGATSGLNHGFEIIEGSCTGTVVACVNSNGSSISESYFNNTFTPGQTYYIRVFNATANLATASFSICVQNYPIPANDLCANATVLTPNANCVNTSGSYSGAFPTAATSCNSGALQDVWFRFTATDPTMSVSLGSVGALNQGFEIIADSCNGSSFACVNNNGSGSAEFYFNNTFTPGKTYYIRVFHTNSSLVTSNFNICVQNYPIPANDLCANATVLTPNANCVNTSGTYSGAFPTAATSCNSGALQDVWFRFTATDPTMSVSLGSVAALNQGFEIIADSCNGSSFACVNNNGSGSAEYYFNNTFTPGKTYYIRVFHTNSSLVTSNFNICVQNYPIPANDLCANATVLTPNATCVNTSGTYSGAFPTAATSCNSGALQDVWFRFTATDPTMSVSLGSVGALNQGFEIIADSCNGSSFACVNNNGSGSAEFYFNNTFTPGKTYYIRVFHTNSSLVTSNFNICVQNYPIPANDLCANATVLTPNATCVNTSGTYSGAFPTAATSCTNTALQDVWFRFTATDPTMSVSLGSVGALNQGFEIIADSCNGTSFACVNNNGSGSAEFYLNNTFTPGKTYYIRVFHTNSSLVTSNFNICVQNYPTPANDLCTNASVLTPNATCVNTTGSFSGSSLSGTVAGCGSAALQDVWYQFTATAANMSLQLAAVSGLNHGIQVFDGSCAGTSLYCINNGGSGSSESVSMTGLVAGNTYYVRIFHLNSGLVTSNFNICLVGPPAVSCTPTISISTGQTTICAGSNVTFTATISNGGTTPAYQWQVNSGNVGSNSATFSSSTLQNGDVVRCILTSNAACASPATANSNTISMTVTPVSTPAFTQVSPICPGGTFTLPATSNNGISGTWSPAINNTATTTYTFTPTAGQCATTATMTVTVNNSTTPAFTQVPAICSGGSFALPATSNNGISGTWSPAINNTATTTYTFTPTAGQCATTATMTVTVNNNTTPAFTQVPAICSGGSFVLPATSNNGISGTWSPAINNTATTTYTFTPTAGQCATTATMTVTVNNSTTPAFTQVPAICSGGSFALPATSNNGISGTWSPAINNTATTTYTFTPTAGQCATTATMTVTVNNSTTPAFTQVPAICSGGSFALPATSNNGISGTWSPAINNTATTTYTFTPTAGQCATTATMTVTVNNNTTPAFTQVPAICSGGSFALPATSNNGISGTWSPAINNTATTTYTFTPTAGQCATTATMTVNVNTVNTSVSVSGITITASATNAGYQWIDCADNTLIGGAQSNSYTATANGSYAVIVTQNGCSDTSICTTIATVGLEEPGKEAPRVYPNPGPGIFVLVTPGQSAGAAYQVLDLSGKVLVNGKIAAEQTHIDLSAYLPGIYLIRLPESSGVLRIIKQ